MKEFFESLKPIQQFVITIGAWLMANCSVSNISTIVALLVLLFQLKVVYYSGKLKKIQYDKENKK